MAFFPVMASTMDFRLNRLLWARGRTAREPRGCRELPALCGQEEGTVYKAPRTMPYPHSTIKPYSLEEIITVTIF